MDYKEQILEDLINALPDGISKDNLVVLHLKEILTSLPTEKEIAKGSWNEFIESREYRMNPYQSSFSREYEHWLDKEAE